jgi:hypothetical protein
MADTAYKSKAVAKQDAQASLYRSGPGTVTDGAATQGCADCSGRPWVATPTVPTLGAPALPFTQSQRSSFPEHLYE